MEHRAILIALPFTIFMDGQYLLRYYWLGNIESYWTPRLVLDALFQFAFPLLLTLAKLVAEAERSTDIAHYKYFFFTLFVYFIHPFKSLTSLLMDSIHGRYRFKSTKKISATSCSFPIRSIQSSIARS